MKNYFQISNFKLSSYFQFLSLFIFFLTISILTNDFIIFCDTEGQEPVDFKEGEASNKDIKKSDSVLRCVGFFALGVLLGVLLWNSHRDTFHPEWK